MTYRSEDRNDIHFDIDASVVFQLGERLISDVVQALVELVKNSYDADAKYATVTVNSGDTADSLSISYPDATGYIIIDDYGDGMDLDTIKRGWLTISNSPKRAMKQRGETTKLGRTPLGDKGLGRLGVQRLGYNVEILTRLEGSPIEHYVAFSWKDFHQEEQLSHVPVRFGTIDPPERKKGTKIIISNLREPEAWTGNAVLQLQTELSAMLSPYEAIKDFHVAANVNGQPLDLIEISAKIRETAQTHYNISFDGERLRVGGRARLSLIRPDQGTAEQKHLYRSLVEHNDGQAFFEHLSDQKNAKQFNLRQAQQKGWFVEYFYEQEFADMDAMQPAPIPLTRQLTFIDVFASPSPKESAAEPDSVSPKRRDSLKANPGPFHGEIDAFSLGNNTVSESVDRLNLDLDQNVFNSARQYREHIKRLAGIRVYRDGFGIRVGRDWLKLGGQQTSGGSWYGLRPDNTLGYIAISARDNAVLEEKTDREGFVVTPYYDNFYEMLSRCVRFAADAEEFIRRQWIAFIRARQSESAGVPEKETPENVASHVIGNLARAESYAEPMRNVTSALDRALDETRNTMRSVAATLPKESTEFRALQATERVLEQNVALAQKTFTQTAHYLSDVGRSKQEVGVLRNQVSALREQIEMMSEAIGLGLTAESLVHEVQNIVDQLAYRNDQIIRYLRSQSPRDARLSAYTSYIETSIAGLRKQLSHFTPSLRYVREQKETIPLFEFFEQEIGDYHRQRLTQENIDVVIAPVGALDFKIRMNRGKLRQIVDNLFLNSEYWVLEELRARRIQRGTITVEIAMPFTRITDNGPGINPSIETTLFEPFVSTKGRGKGRGLGLFVVQQLLDSEGCSIILLPHPTGRPHTFEIDFTGALDAGQ